ncbi:hypothetical protein [Jejuia spongiicola]|uniref:Uncharacterized protein n=1 Tax=Jejuia spongiicola TaxID=2942207 RepID=A0ABT0QAX1_9FLAO|nr:hypothetical protein [Jejuia spongiicola]MCL6293633.1 hypothetical protein [Jejuia spongiicola]
MSKNIIRQIVDIQAQAERLIKTKADMIEIELFAKYNREIKSFLIANIDDDFVLSYVRKIPDLNIKKSENKWNVITLILIIFSSFSRGIALYNERRMAQKYLSEIRDIRGSYASAEFMLKNYFAN